MDSHTVIQKGFIESKALTIGIVLGAAIGIGGQHVVNNVLDLVYPTPKEVVCQKGILFEQITWGGNVYLKTKKECLETSLLEKIQ